MAFTAADLSGVDFGGLINEDVMQQIWDISRIPLPYSDMVGTSSSDNAYTEWTEDELAQPNLANAAIDGQELTDDDSRAGERLGNQHQISTKRIDVSNRANNSDTIGRAREYSYQVMMRQQELRRDREAIALTGQGSVADDGTAVAGLTAGLGAMITQGNRTGSGGGFTSGVWAAYVPGTFRALTETMVRDVAQQVWEEGGNPSVIMSVPAQIRRLSEYMFTSSARIATLGAETNQNGPATAMGSVNVFLTDFGVELAMIPNRLQPFYDSAGGSTDDACAMFFIDSQYVEFGELEGVNVTPLAKTGLSEPAGMSVDWSNKLLNRKALGVIHDLDYTAPVTL